jgi:hypothetical protein
MIEALDIPIFAVHDCDVAVDPDTGKVDVLKYRVVQDVGRAINPRAIREQIQGEWCRDSDTQCMRKSLSATTELSTSGASRPTDFSWPWTPSTCLVTSMKGPPHSGHSA